VRVRTFDSGATLTNLEYRLILYDTAGKSGGICARTSPSAHIAKTGVSDMSACSAA
jgi:hypothetical protein